MRDKKADVEPASMMKRAGAFVLDLLILDFIVFMPFDSLIRNLVPESFKAISDSLKSSPGLNSKLLTIAFFMGLLSLLYFSVMEYKFNQTLGKILFNIRVENLRNGKLTYMQALARSLFFIPLFPFYLLWIIDPIYLFFSRSRQRLLEVLTITRVVQTKGWQIWLKNKTVG